MTIADHNTPPKSNCDKCNASIRYGCWWQLQERFNSLVLCHDCYAKFESLWKKSRRVWGVDGRYRLLNDWKYIDNSGNLDEHYLKTWFRLMKKYDYRAFMRFMGHPITRKGIKHYYNRLRISIKTFISHKHDHSRKSTGTNTGKPTR